MVEAPKEAAPARERQRWVTGGVVAAAFAGGVLVGAGGVLVMSDDDAPVAASPSQEPSSETSDSDIPEVISYNPSLTTIEYEIVTDGMSVTHLSWVDVIDGVPEMQEKLGTPPPFQHVIQLPKNESFDLSDLSVTGMGAATSTTTTCTLRIDGSVVSRQTADGTYGVVSCSVPEE